MITSSFGPGRLPPQVLDYSNLHLQQMLLLQQFLMSDHFFLRNNLVGNKNYFSDD